MQPSGQLPSEYVAALVDEGSQALREQLVREVSRYLHENGSRLCVHHWLDGYRPGHAFGTVAEIAAELTSGAAQLAGAKHFYAAAALTRQLLECGYLFDIAAQSPEELGRWHRGDPGDRRAQFTPVKLRRRSTSGFRDAEYRAHCEHGGHPHPRGAHLLGNPAKAVACGFWADLALHAAETWDLFCLAVPHYDPRARGGDVLYSPDRSPEGRYQMDIVVRAWREADEVAQRSTWPVAA